MMNKQDQISIKKGLKKILGNWLDLVLNFKIWANYIKKQELSKYVNKKLFSYFPIFLNEKNEKDSADF